MVYYRLNNFNTRCAKCSLLSGTSVSGQTEVPFSQVELVIVSAFPGSLEVASGLSLAPGDPNSSKMNAGKFLRWCLEKVFDLDVNFPSELKPFSKRVFYTNAIKCPTQRGQDKLTVSNKNIEACRDQWLVSELNLFGKDVPILAGGSEACKSVLGLTQTVFSSRGKVHSYRDHPVVVSTNPIEWERGALKELSHGEETINDLDSLYTRYKNPKKDFVEKVLDSRYWSPIPLGSALWFAKQDLEMVKELVINRYKRSVGEQG